MHDRDLGQMSQLLEIDWRNQDADYQEARNASYDILQASEDLFQIIQAEMMFLIQGLLEAKDTSRELSKIKYFIDPVSE